MAIRIVTYEGEKDSDYTAFCTGLSQIGTRFKTEFSLTHDQLPTTMRWCFEDSQVMAEGVFEKFSEAILLLSDKVTIGSLNAG